MAQNFGEIRNVELSTVFYIEDSFESGWSGVTVVKGYPNFAKINPPVIAVRINNILSPYLEIGSRTTFDIYNIIIDIFATSDGQKLDLAQYIKTIILENWTYYIWSRGSGNTMDRTASGKIVLSDIIQNSPVFHADDVDSPDRFRHIISFDVRVARNA